MRLYTLLLASSAAALGIRAPSNSSCSLIYDDLKEAIRTNSSSFVIPGQTAQDCLLSMPFDSGRAGRFLEELRKYIEFQSTLEPLKDPPESYTSSPVDILGGLDKISRNNYSSQYEFDLDINALINTANDGHFNVQLCSLQLLGFSLKPPGLISISKDGLEKPEMYLVPDAALQDKGSKEVSPIAKINGQDASKYLDNIAKEVTSQDPDAQWNSLFSSAAVAAGGDTSAADGHFINHSNIWPGSNVTMIEFRNGSSFDIPVIAQLQANGFNTTGEDLYETYCMPQPPKESPTPPSLPPLKSGPKGWPEPAIRDPYNQINGFELNDDTMVMYIPSFADGSGLPENQSAVFAEVATEIVNHATSTGRNKMIIDISANGGGTIVRAFDLFKLFFPNEFPYSGTRFRRSNATESLVQMTSRFNETEAGDISLVYQYQVTPDQEDGFASVDEFLGEEEQLGAEVSSLFANFNYTATSDEENPIRGFGEKTDTLNKTQPFKPEDILIVGDGMCASTCTTFVNLMTNIGGVRTVAFGGRPRTEPMQIMGGVRGAQSFPFSYIETIVQAATAVHERSIDSDGKNKLLDPDDLERANNSLPLALEKFPLQLPGGSVNFRNAYQEGNNDLPLQFEYQASDCRLFYTFENVNKPATIWSAAVKAMWGDGECIQGSTGGKGSREFNTSSSNSGDDTRRGEGANAAVGVKLGGGFLGAAVSICALALI